MMDDRGDDGWQRHDPDARGPSDDPSHARGSDGADERAADRAAGGPYGYTHDPYAQAPPPPQPQPYGHEASAQPVQEQRTNVFAVVSIAASAFGLVGVIPLIGSIVGIVFAVLARKEIEADPSQQGKALADWGLILGVVGLVFWFFMGLMMMFMATLFGDMFWWDMWWY